MWSTVAQSAETKFSDGLDPGRRPCDRVGRPVIIEEDEETTTRTAYGPEPISIPDPDGREHGRAISDVKGEPEYSDDEYWAVETNKRQMVATPTSAYGTYQTGRLATSSSFWLAERPE